jgi:stress-induced morphogen
MLPYKNLFSASFKCRICAAHFSNPEDLRIHRMVNHKGHMLTIKR